MKEKRRDLTQSYDKNPFTHKNSKKESENSNTPPKTSISQRLRIDFDRTFSWIDDSHPIEINLVLEFIKEPSAQLNNIWRNQRQPYNHQDSYPNGSNVFGGWSVVRGTEKFPFSIWKRFFLFIQLFSYCSKLRVQLCKVVWIIQV